MIFAILIYKEMKMRQNILFILIVMVVLAACASQKPVPANPEVRNMIENRNYTFIARNVTPTEDARYNPRMIFPNASSTLYQLNGEYDLRITRDSVIAYLPFFGRAYTAPVNPSEGGIKFASTDFDYRESMRKNNYEIEIIPRDAKDVRNLYLTITPNGYASLRVLSLNRTAISFNGEIEANK